MGFLDLLSPEPKLTKARPAVRVLLPADKGKYYLQRALRSNDRVRVPGGGIEPGEHRDDAAVRELNEEFGLHPEFVKKHLKYLGPDHRPEYAHEHYYILPTHGLHSGKYTASNDPNEIVELVEANAAGDKYWGPDVNFMLKHQQKKASITNLLSTFLSRPQEEQPNVNPTSASNSVVGPEDKSVNGVLNDVPEGPFFRFVSLKNGLPTGLHSATNIPQDDPRRANKPDESWLPPEASKQPGASYWTQHGLRKYLNSGLYDWHKSVTPDDLAVLVSKKLKKKPKYKDEYQVISDPNEFNQDDMYYIDRNRSKPLTAIELLARYAEPLAKEALRITMPRRLSFPLPIPKWLSKAEPAIADAVEHVKAPPIELPKLETPSVAVPPVEAKPGIGSWLGEQAKYTAGMEPNQKFWSFAEPSPKYQIPENQNLTWYNAPLQGLRHVREKVTSPARYALDNYIGKYIVPTPIRATARAAFTPQYPVVEPFLQRHGMGFVPKTMRGLSTAGTLGSLGLTANALLDDIPHDAANEAYQQGYLSRPAARKLYEGSRGLGMASIYRDILTGDDPLSKAHRDVAKETLLPGIRFGLHNARKAYPGLMSAIDIGKSFTPVGALSTAISHAGASDTPPDVEGAIRRAVKRYGKDIADNPEEAINSPLGQSYSKLFNDAGVKDDYMFNRKLVNKTTPYADDIRRSFMWAPYLPVTNKGTNASKHFANPKVPMPFGQAVKATQGRLPLPDEARRGYIGKVDDANADAYAAQLEASRDLKHNHVPGKLIHSIIEHPEQAGEITRSLAVNKTIKNWLEEMED